MSRRLDRRYALLLGVVLSLWAVTNDLAVFPPDFTDDATASPAPEVREAPVRPVGRPASSAPGPDAGPPGDPGSG